MADLRLIQYNECAPGAAPGWFQSRAVSGGRERMNLRQKLLIVGGVAGAVVGVFAAFLYIKANERRIDAVEAGEAEEMNQVSPGEAISLGVSLLGVLRLISELGQRKK